jgi:hypothetical protein
LVKTLKGGNGGKGEVVIKEEYRREKKKEIHTRGWSTFMFYHDWQKGVTSISCLFFPPKKM